MSVSSRELYRYQIWEARKNTKIQFRKILEDFENILKTMQKRISGTKKNKIEFGDTNL